MNAETAQIKFVIGSRRLFAVPRRVRTVVCPLEALIDGVIPDFGADDAASEGFRIVSVPPFAVDGIARRFPHHVVGGLHAYRRHYIDMAGSFADYLARFSGKTRSTFNRKRRRLAAFAEGTLQVEEFRTPDAMERFFAEAIPLSRRTYQARLLDAGLPEDAERRAEAAALAARDRLRAYLLRVKGQAIAYLYLPMEGDSLVYAYLGYDPDYAVHSPGTVLQLEALERLFAEKRYRYFDFTEGEGDHKALFGTDSVDACSFFLLRRRWSNRLLLGMLDAFDGAVAGARQVALRSGALAHIRKALRA